MTEYVVVGDVKTFVDDDVADGAKNAKSAETAEEAVNAKATEVVAAGTAQAREQATSNTGLLADTVVEAEKVGVDCMTSAPNIIVVGDKVKKAVGSADAVMVNMANNKAKRAAGSMDAVMADMANDSGLNANKAIADDTKANKVNNVATVDGIKI